MVRKLLQLFILILLPGALLLAQTEEVQLKVYGFEEGLSHRNVFQIQQDSNGFIWMATVNGLNKYDGYEFKQFAKVTETVAIFQEVTVDMALGPENRLWLAHPNYLSIADPTGPEIKQHAINETSMERGEEQTPYNLVPAGPDVVWSTTYIEKTGASFLEKYNAKGERLVHIPLPGNAEHRPLLLQDGLLYVGGYLNELWVMDLSGNVREKYAFESNARVVSLQGGSDGRIYALLEDGSVYTRGSGQDRFVSHLATDAFNGKGSFQTFFVEETGNIWAGGEGVLFYFNQDNRQVIDFNEEVQEVTKHETTYRQIFRDQSGVFWIASNFGAIKLVRSQKLFDTYLSGGNSQCSSGFCSMRGIAEDDAGNIYLSYYNSIHKLDPERGEVTPLFGNANFVHPPFGLTYYRGHLFTGSGLRINLQNLRVDSLLSNENTGEGVPIVDSGGQLWLGTGQNLYQYDVGRGVFNRYLDASGILDTFNYTITHLHEGKRSGVLWIATVEHGLYRLDRSNGEMEPFPAKKDGEFPLSHKRVLSVYEDQAGNLWVATALGLNQIDLVTGRVRVYGTSHGLPNNFVNGLLSEGDSCLWISTDYGLGRFHIKSKKFLNFFKRDGLPANEFNRISFFKSRTGRFYFGGLNGVIAFSPGPEYYRQKKRREGKLLLTQFSKYDGEHDSLISQYTDLDPEKGIRLSYKDKFFTFGFALADYANPRENLFSYKLVGYEEDWSPATTINSARYNNIPAGEYQFQVRASAVDDTNWNEELLSVPVKIDQAYYKTRWFIILSALSLILLLYAIMRFRIYRIRQREKYLEEQVRERTLELEIEKKKSDDLLLNILPEETAEELKLYGSAKAKRFDLVSVMFCDFSAFTKIAEQMEPEALVAEIDYCFRAFDEIIEMYNLEKIKTIGDAYLCVGGMHENSREGAINMVKAALEIQAFLEAISLERKERQLPFFECRIGIHSGPIVAGIVGIKKFAYDIWGDTVNLAARLETNGVVKKVNVSQTTYDLIKDDFICEHRGKVKAKNKGQVDMYFVERLK